MIRIRATLLAALAAAVGFVPTLAFGEAATVRIEPRNYYGATVTIEKGVRVYRPLPPVKYMVVNPGNAPVSLNLTDVNERHTSTNYNYHYGDGSSGAAGVPQGGGFGFVDDTHHKRFDPRIKKVPGHFPFSRRH